MSNQKSALDECRKSRLLNLCAWLISFIFFSLLLVILPLYLGIKFDELGKAVKINQLIIMSAAITVSHLFFGILLDRQTVCQYKKINDIERTIYEQEKMMKLRIYPH